MSLLPKELDSRGKRSWKVTTASVFEPISVTEVKTFGRIDGSDEDDLLETMIIAVRDASEKYTGRAFMEQTITLVMDFWPSDVIELPRPPLISITGVYTTDEDDSDTEYDSDYYYTDTISIPGKLILKTESTYPSNTERYHSGYKIIYKAGYGDEEDDVPQLIRNALKIWVMDFYENRIFDPNDVPRQVKGFLDLVKVPRGL